MPPIDAPVEFPDDGLIKPVVGAWAEEKYRLVAMYNRLFSTGMKKHWDLRVYLDLFAGAGIVRVRGTRRLLEGSPLLAFSLPDKYNRYILCEQDKRCFDALAQRIKIRFAEVDTRMVFGDCNSKIDEILAHLPHPSKEQKVLSFCFLDPFSLRIEFKTIERLSQYFVDFLMLLALSMDGVRNLLRYLPADNSRIEKFLGLQDWRTRWEEYQKKDQSFQRFLAREHASQMMKLGYRKEALDTMIEIRSDDKNLPLYHLAFYSRHTKGYEFWGKVRKYVIQPDLFGGT